MSDLRSVLSECGFSFNKQFGQNFITDTNLLDAIVNDAGIQGGTVLEIGAGAGTLTAAIARKADKVVSYEVDRNLMPVLSRTLAGLDDKAEVIFRDIMKESDQSLDEVLGGEYRLVANLPYYITTPVIMKFLERENKPVSMTVMVQKEVGDRLAAEAGDPDYGAVTAAVRLEGDVRLTRIVPRTLFYPAPKVDSCIIRIDMHGRYDSEDKPLVKKLIRSAFAMRRKTLVNNLASSAGLTKEQAVRLVTAAGKDERVRGETLSVDDYVALSRLYKEIIKT